MSSGDFCSATNNHFRALWLYESRSRFLPSEESLNTISVPVNADRNSNFGEYYNQDCKRKTNQICVLGETPFP